MAVPALLNDDSNIKEFIEILKNNKLDTQVNEFTALIGHFSAIENQLYSALGEVNKLEKRVNQMEDKQFKNVCKKMVNNLKSAIHEAKVKLGELKTAFVEGAKNAIVSFKEAGISALNAVMKFFKVRDGLEALKESADKSIASANQSIQKINKISSEIHKSGSHRRNIFRIIAGKATKNDVKENGRVAEAVKLPFKAARATMANIRQAAVSASKKLDSLDKTAQMGKEKKPSLLQNIKAYKPPERAANPAKSRDTALE